MKLYGYWRSTSTWRVRIALSYKNIPYETVPVHLVRNGGEQNAPPYRALNPARTVPLLEESEDGREWRLAQSMAIIEYLEERFPTPPLLPAEPRARAKARQYAEQVNSGIQPLQNLSVNQYVKSELRGDDRAWARHWMSIGLEALERQVSMTAGRFCVGDAVSVADVYLVPQLFNARRYDLDLASLPGLLRIEAACLAVPAFASSHPDRQPDAEPASKV